jgi:hypothetical protein
MTTLAVYCGWTKVHVDEAPQYMGGFRVIYPDRFDITCPCDVALFDTSEEAVEFAQRLANGYLTLLETLEIIPPQMDVAWEDISPPN